ncbi:MFS transporter [Adhaeribacter pallidiroseus]|uniref:Purine efflux pump PbuE n=1 Tax=Adhaeribacter pallidiroseus TaxID=2072847 RepID=A0A369QLE5_9BACT|nr:MFS transporter [Adhaeribacter pallidiroseus]RDC65192.1 Purine efflux pump PbuE [Adhaeribacter pallidiroseus]
MSETDSSKTYSLTQDNPNSIVPPLVIREGWLLFILAAIQFTHIIDFVIMMPLGPQLMRVFDISPKQFGLLVSAYTFAAAFSGFISTFFIDKFDRKNALLALYVGFIVGTFCCAIAPNYQILMLARVLAGAFGGVIGALVFSIIGDVVPEARRGSATGKVMAAFSAASIIGIPVGLYLASISSWHAPFFGLAGLSVLVLFVAIKFLPTMRGHLTNAVKTKPVQLVLDIITNRNLLWALTLMIVLTLAGFTVVPFISPYMVGNIGFAETELAFIYLCGGLASVVTSQLAGKLADKYGKQRVFIYSALFSIIPIILVTNMPRVPHYVALIITTSFFIGFGARFVPAVSLLTSSVEKRLRGSFMSFQSSVQQLASGLSAFLAGLIIQKTPTGEILHFNTVGIIACVATVFCMFIITRLKVVS